MIPRTFLCGVIFLSIVKNFLKITVAICILALLFGCTASRPVVDDGLGEAYHDADYRTEYANVFEFDNYEGQPYFVVAFLGYGDIMEYRNTYIKGVFEALPEGEIEKISHLDYEGDEWYLVIPRYREYVTITYLETDETDAVYTGEAFTIKCNLSDLHSNVEISIDSHSGQKFSPQLDGTGKLAASQVVWDITDYSD